MRRTTLAVALISTWLASRHAYAQTAPPWATVPDVIVLRDGTRLEGRAVDVRIGEAATIRASDGSLRVVRWTDVERASGPSFDGPSPPAAPPSPPSNDADPAVTPRFLQQLPGTIPIVVASDGPPLTVSSVLETRRPWNGYGPFSNLDDPTLGAAPRTQATSFGPFAPHSTDETVSFRTRTLCTTPCTLYLPPGHTSLHVGGTGRLESVQTVEARNRPMRITFRSASSTTFGTGIVFTLFGAALSAAGTFALVAEETGGSSPYGQPLMPIALGCMIAGALGLAVGVPLLGISRTGIAQVAPIDGTPHAPRPTASLVAQWVGGAGTAGLRVTF